MAALLPQHFRRRPLGSLAAFGAIALGLVSVLNAAPAPAPAPAPAVAAQEIDALLAAHWKASGVSANAPASDEVFLRRVYLDVIGRIPTSREAVAFLESKNPKKRAALIAALLESEGYVQHFFNYWADVLRVQTTARSLGASTGYAYANFLKASLRQNKPYNQLVRELVSANGVAWENGAIGFYMRDRGMPLENMAITSRIFLGTRIECAQCHDHPFDKWSQMEFYQLAAFTYGIDEGDFYGRIGLRRVAAQRARAVDEQYAREKAASADGGKAAAAKRAAALASPNVDMHSIVNVLNQIQGPFLGSTEQIEHADRALKLPHDYKYEDAKPLSIVAPATIMGPPATVPSGTRRSEVFAAWLTAPENPRFTAVLANRLWKQLFGAALFEPFDELTDTSKAVIPELETYLESLLIKQQYDMKAFLAVLLNTHAYQSAVTKAEYDAGEAYHFPGPLLRRMSAAQIWDSFITLMQPNPDARNLAADADAAERLNLARKINDAFQVIPPEELFDRAVTASAAFREQSQKLKALQTEIDAARSEENLERVRELGKKVSDYEAVTRQAVIDHVLSPILTKLTAKATGGQVTVLAGNPGETPKGNGTLAVTSFTKNTRVPGYDPMPKSAAQQGAEREAQRGNWAADAQALGVPEKEYAEYISYRERMGGDWLRAAELESPAPRGHFLRELGQSDREFVENGSTAASVPQALLLMNSPLVTRLLSRYSPLMLAVNHAPTPETKLEAACLALFSRKPTAQEKAAWSKAASGGLRSTEDLVFALLNTRQFLFIQ